MSKVIQIDPVGCGCTECLTGLYVPLDRATKYQVRAMVTGKMYDATSEDFTLTTVTEHCTSPGAFTMLTLRANYSGLEWTWNKD